MKKIITAGELLERHFKPDHEVLCVGANNSPRLDPSPFFLGRIAARGRGRVHLIAGFGGSAFQKIGGRGKKIVGKARFA